MTYRRAVYWTVVTVMFLPFLVLEAASRLRERADGWFWRLQEWAHQDRH